MLYVFFSNWRLESDHSTNYRKSGILGEARGAHAYRLWDAWTAGAPKAITATAHKLARLIYNMLKYGSAFVDAGQEQYEERYRSRVLQVLNVKHKKWGTSWFQYKKNPKRLDYINSNTYD